MEYHSTVQNPPIAHQILEAALADVAAPILKVKNEDTFDALDNTPVSKDHPCSTIRLTKSNSSVWIGNVTGEYIASFLALAEDTAAPLFRVAERAAESDPDTNVLLEIQAVLDRAVAKPFQGLALQTAAVREMRNFLGQSHIINDIATYTTGDRPLRPI